MLLLDHPLWAKLQHAYSNAADIPELLRALAASPAPETGDEAEPWHSLWSSLCHQGDIYTASYAAVPHIVQIACETRTPIDFSFFLLPASIEVARQTGRGPEIPEDIEADYHHAIARLVEAIGVHQYDPWDKSMLRSAMAAQAVAKGHIDFAEAIMYLDEDLIGRIRSGDFE
jgi:hypothetical protein